MADVEAVIPTEPDTSSQGIVARGIRNYVQCIGVIGTIQDCPITLFFK